MNDEPAFLAAIAASPNDQTLLLVFADWLEERGDPRGAWLRLEAVRPWMGQALADPIPVLLAALVKGEQVTRVGRAAAAIGAAIVPGLVGLLAHEAGVVRLRAVKCLRAIGAPAKAALPALFEMIRDPSTAVRGEAGRAAKAIGMAGATETAALRDALTDTDARIRYQAAAMLGSMRAKRAVKDDLAGRLDDPDPVARRAAVEALGNLKSKTAVGAFCRALTDPDAAVRLVAARRLGGLVDPKSAGAVEPLRRALGDADAEVRRHAVQALSAIGPAAAAAVPDILELLAHGVPEDRPIVALALGKIGVGHPEALGALLGAVRDERADVRTQAATGLRFWPDLPARAAPALLDLLRRPVETDSGKNHTHAIILLGRLSDPTAEVIHELRRWLTQSDRRFQVVAAKALGELGPAAADAVPDLIALAESNGGHGEPEAALARTGGEGLAALVRLLGHEPNRGWWAAGAGLRLAGPAALPFLPELRALLRRVEDPFRRARVVEVIAAIGSAAADAIPDILPLVLHDHPRLHTAAIDSLRLFGPALVPFLPPLADILRRPELRGRHERVVRLLAEMAPHSPDLLDSLREAIRQLVPADGARDRPAQRAGIAQAAIAGLTALGPAAAPAAAELALLLSAEFPPSVRREAATALGATRAAAAAHLAPALHDPDSEVRARATDALGLLGETSEGTISALTASVRDAHPRVRRAAVDALGRLRPSSEAVVDALRVAEHDPDKMVRVRAGVAVRKIAGRPGKNG